MKNKVYFFAGVMLIAMLALSGCSSIPESVEITVVMSEFAYEPVDIELKVGQEVTIKFINNGVQEHEFMVGHDVDDHDGFPNGFEEDFFETGGVEPMVMGGMDDMDMDDDHEEEEDGHDDSHAGFMVMVPEGDASYSIQFTVTEEMLGEWEIGCFLQEGSHYDEGMYGNLTVSN